MSRIVNFHWKVWPGLVVSLVLGTDAWAEASPEALLSRAQACTAVDSRLERLGCYDALFQRESEVPTPADPRSALWHTINAQEAERNGDDMGLLVREVRDDVRISVPALGSVPPRPHLVFACENNITRFQLHLPQALEAPRVQVRLRSSGRELEQVWQARDGGYVVSGGRGLPGIATLQQLLNGDELALASDQVALDGLRFEIKGLRQALQPLREACRW